MSDDLLIPDKHLFKIGEVADLLAVRPHVLRYWESEFAALKPRKSKSNQRLYRRRDIELLREIKRLLYTERLTVAGARKRLREKPAVAEPPGDPVPATSEATQAAPKELVARVAELEADLGRRREETRRLRVALRDGLADIQRLAAEGRRVKKESDGA